METRANPLIVGLFALAVIAGAFGFVFWMGSYGSAGDRTPYHVVFQGEVTGLTEGSTVLYNGIRVGDVASLGLAPNDPSRIVATIRVQNGYPITKTTQAQLQFQTLTGVAYVQLQPGEAEAEPLPPGGTIVAQRSNFQDLLESGQSLMTKIDSIAGKLDTVLTQNQDAVSATVKNVQSFTQALADNSGNVQSFLSDAAMAARRLNELGEKVGRLSDSLDGIVGAINPDDVRQAVSDARKFTDSLAENAGRINQIADNVTQASERFNGMAANLEGAGQRVSDVAAAVDPARISNTLANIDTFSGQLATAGQQLDGLMTDVRGAATRVDQVGGSVNTLVAAIDPERINSVMSNAETFTSALARNGDQLDTLMQEAQSAVKEIGSAGTRIAALSADLDKVVAAVDPDTLSSSLSNIDTFSGQLSTAGQNLDGLVADVRSAAQRIDEIGNSVNSVIAAIDTARIGNVIANAESFTSALARNGGEIDGLVADARTAVRQLGDAGGRVGTLSDTINGVVSDNAGRISNSLANLETFSGQLSSAGGQLDGVMADVRGAVGQVGQAGERVNTLVAAIDPARLGNTVSNAESFTAALARNGDAIDGLVQDTRTAVTSLGEAGAKVNDVVGAVDPEAVKSVVSNVRQFSDALAANADKVTMLADKAVSAVDRIDRVGAQLETIGDDVKAITAAVDPQKVSSTLDSIESFSSVLGRNSGEIEGFVTDARAAAQSISEAGNKVAAIGDSAQKVVDAVDPEQVRAVLGDVRNFTDMLSNNRELVANFLVSASSAADQVGSLAGRANTLVEAIDPQSIQRSVTNVESFTVGLASKTDQVESFIDDASAVASQLRTTSEKLDKLLSQANGMLEGQGGGFFTEATEAAKSIRKTADNLNSQIDAIGGDVQRYGTGGLKQFQQLMSDGRQTLGELERVIKKLSQNPAGFFSGSGSQVQEYNPGRRF